MTTDPNAAPVVPSWLHDGNGDLYRIGIKKQSLNDLADTDATGAADGDLLVRDAALGKWVTESRPLVDTGTVTQFAGATAPAGWLLCDGTAVSRTTYAALFTACGVTYGSGDGSTTFNLPNLAGRVPTGVKVTQSEFDTIGKVGGEKSHVLSVEEIPSHVHAQSAHGHSLRVGFVTNPNSAFSITNNSGDEIAGSDNAPQNSAVCGPFINMGWKIGSTTPTLRNAGSGSGHDILQPYICMNFIIKT